MKFYLDSNRFIETNNPLDISIPLSNTDENLRAWHVDLPVIEPVRAHGFVGAVAEGGSVNFRNIFFNPHGHGTHTECLGHITPTVYSVNQSLKMYFFTAELVSIEPEKIHNNSENVDDYIINQVHATDGRSKFTIILKTLTITLLQKHC